MSCESSQNKVSDAGHSSGISRTANKFANYTGRILTPAVVIGGGGAAVAGGIYSGTKTVNYILNKIKEARARAAAEKAARARQKVALVKDASRRKAALDIQSTYIGAGIFRPGLNEVLEEPDYTRLGGKTWLAAGANGSALVDDLGDDTYMIRGIGLELGKELELRNGLAAYTFRHPDLAKKALAALSPKSKVTPSGSEESRLMKAVRTAGQTAVAVKDWVSDNQEEVKVIAGTGFQAALLLAEMKMTKNLWGSVRPSRPMTKLGYAYKAANLAADTYNTIQKARMTKVEAARVVETIRSPEYPRAAAALQKQYNGVQVSRRTLESLIQAKPQPVIDGTYKLQGSLGIIYYDQGENGQISIQRVIPSLGKELQLYQGLKTLAEVDREKLTGQPGR
jgi:hypothetical protein